MGMNLITILKCTNFLTNECNKLYKEDSIVIYLLNVSEFLTSLSK